MKNKDSYGNSQNIAKSYPVAEILRVTVFLCLFYFHMYFHIYYFYHYKTCF